VPLDSFYDVRCAIDSESGSRSRGTSSSQVTLSP